MNWKVLMFDAGLMLAIAGGLMLLAHMEQQDLERAQSTYCSMTALFKATNGQHGWPEYDGPCED